MWVFFCLYSLNKENSEKSIDNILAICYNKTRPKRNTHCFIFVFENLILLVITRKISIYPEKDFFDLKIRKI